MQNPSNFSELLLSEHLHDTSVISMYFCTAFLTEFDNWYAESFLAEGEVMASLEAGIGVRAGISAPQKSPGSFVSLPGISAIIN